MSALLQAPYSDVETDGTADDHALVARVRRGDDRAFEGLYERYHRRIHAYVLGMVKDHQRAEDVTQEVFVSALRRMRATERPIAFKPWIYEIAKNACIDQFRRSRRAEEVSFDADEGLAPSDYTRLVSREPVPDAAFAAKQQLDHLCGAFGGLSEAHHEILVLRELEGLSYREIGERMGMSRPAVESTLFRARRRLTEEYDELASGQRCLRIHGIITAACEGRLGARDTRRLARHVAHCQPCRRQAVAAGVPAALLARQPGTRERVAAKVALLFPFPALLRGRRGGGSDSWLSQLPMFSDHASAGGAKLAALAALLVAGVGVGTQGLPGLRDDGPSAAARPAAVATHSAAAPAAAAKPASVAAPSAGTSAARMDRGSVSRGRQVTHARFSAGSRMLSAGGAKPRTSTGSRPAAAAPAAAGDVQKTVSGSTPSAPRSGGGSSPSVTVPAVTLPSASVPQSTIDTAATFNSAVDTAGSATGAVTDTLDTVTSGATAPVSGAVNGAAGLLPTLP